MLYIHRCSYLHISYGWRSRVLASARRSRVLASALSPARVHTLLPAARLLHMPAVSRLARPLAAALRTRHRARIHVPYAAHCTARLVPYLYHGVDEIDA
jgi:hypothetical protein